MIQMIFLHNLCGHARAASLILSVDFDTSMQLNRYPTFLDDPYNNAVYHFFKKQYLRNNPAIIPPQEELLIPKKIHWIWLGSPLPEIYTSNIQSWIDKNPGWEYKIWTDADVEDFQLINKNLFDAIPNYGAKSDIWRYEILERFGGLYVDIDQECLQAFTPLHHTYHFYTGLQPLDTGRLHSGISIIGSMPHHPILKKCIEQLPHYQQEPEVIIKTGPLFFTDMLFLTARQSSLHTIVFPASYFFPCNYTQKGQAQALWIKPESYAVHHWAGSWLDI